MYTCLKTHSALYNPFMSIFVAVGDTYEDTGNRMTAVTLTAMERQNYERLFGDAVIQFGRLCVDKSIGEGRQCICLMLYIYCIAHATPEAESEGRLVVRKSDQFCTINIFSAVIIIVKLRNEFSNAWGEYI